MNNNIIKIKIKINREKNSSNKRKQLKSETHCHICKKLISRKNYKKHTYLHFKPKDNKSYKTSHESYNKKSSLNGCNGETNKNLGNNISINNILSNNKQEINEIENDDNKIKPQINNQNTERILINEFQKLLPKTNSNEIRMNFNKEIDKYQLISDYNELISIDSINSEESYLFYKSIQSEYSKFSFGIIPKAFH